MTRVSWSATLRALWLPRRHYIEFSVGYRYTQVRVFLLCLNVHCLYTVVFGHLQVARVLADGLTVARYQVIQLLTQAAGRQAAVMCQKHEFGFGLIQILYATNVPGILVNRSSDTTEWTLSERKVLHFDWCLQVFQFIISNKWLKIQKVLRTF